MKFSCWKKHTNKNQPTNQPNEEGLISLKEKCIFSLTFHFYCNHEIKKFFLSDTKVAFNWENLSSYANSGKMFFI